MINRACISIHNRCDLNCKYCYFYNRTDINTSSILNFNLEELKEIINNIVQHSMKNNIKFTVGLVGAGESLLNFTLIKELIKWVRSCNYNKYIRFYTISNGYNTTTEQIRFFNNNKDIIDISISLDGYKELHNLCRTSFSNKDSYSNVIKTIIKYKEVFKTYPNINLTVHKQTFLNKEKLFDYLVSEGFKNITFSKLVDYNKSDLFISEYQFEEFIDYIETKNEMLPNHKRLKIRNIEVKNKKRDCTMYGAECGAGTEMIFYCNKKVYPCGRFTSNDDYILGNYNDTLSLIEQNAANIMKNNPKHICYFNKFVEQKGVE